MSSSKVDRFTSNQGQSDHRPILHISSNIFHHRKYLVFVIFVCLSVCMSYTFRSLNIVSI